MVPRPTMEAELKKEEKELSDDIKNLEKKVRLPPVLSAFFLSMASEQIP